MFKRAAAIKETPRVLAQMAFAEQALGQWVEAEGHLKSALQSKNDPWIVKNTVVIGGALKNIGAHLGSLEVWGTPAGAEILVDGQVMGTFPSSGALRRPLGEVTVTVRHPGFVEVTRVVEVQRGGLVRENIDLHAVPPRPPVALDPQAGAAASSASRGQRGPAGARRGGRAQRRFGHERQRRGAIAHLQAVVVLDDRRRGRHRRRRRRVRADPPDGAGDDL